VVSDDFSNPARAVQNIRDVQKPHRPKKIELRSYNRVCFELLVISFSLIMGIGLARAFLPIMGLELDPAGSLAGFITSAWYMVRDLIELPSSLGQISETPTNLNARALGICHPARAVQKF
jgi:hypothetical protein